MLFFLAREHAENPVDRLSGVDRVQRAENDVAGFRSGHRDIERFAIANFADKNCLRRLPQGRAQAIGKVGEILAQLALADRRLAVFVEKFDRIFQRHDVDLLALVQLVQHRGQRRRLAGAGSAGHQNDAVLLSHDFAKDRRQLQFFERRNFRLKFSHHDGVAAVLFENVNAEPGEIFDRIAAIARANGGKFHPQPFAAIDDVPCYFLDQGRRQDRLGRVDRKFAQAAVHFHQRRFAGDEKQIGNAVGASQHSC